MDGGNENNAAAAAIPVQAVSLKLPTFWTKQPQVWFAQAEAEFSIRNIAADNTKFHYVVASLDQDTASSVLSLIRAPPDTGKYDALKTALESTYGLSKYERINRIIDMPDLGDDKPSTLMNKMLALLDDRQPCDFVRCHFLRRLPEHIRATLVHSGTEDCRSLARAADQLWEAHQTTTSAIRSEHRPVQTSNHEGLCYYHRKFGSKATKCRTPCTFSTPPSSGNGQAGRQ